MNETSSTGLSFTVEHDLEIDKFVTPHELQLGTLLFDVPFTFLMGGWQMG